MAEQIRSFWSHLCGIFGAIFGMIAGGTLVTIEKADAASVSGLSTCGTLQNVYTNETLSNGAVVNTCYGGGWLCGLVTENSGVPAACSGNYGNCYVMNVYKNYPRYYVYFMGCADGYYSTEGVGLSPLVTSTISSSTAVAGNYLGTRIVSGLTSSITSTTGYNPITGKQERCYGHDNIRFNTSSFKLNGWGEKAFTGSVSARPDYMQDPSLVTAGKCEKCPSFGEYAARSLGATYAKNISSCFMTSYAPRSDAADQLDGVATGQFVWTNACHHDGDTATYLAPACRNKVASGSCSISLASYSNKSSAVAWVAEVCGGTASCKSMASGGVGTTTMPWKFRSSISCDAAKCYKEAAAADGVNFSYRDESAVSPDNDQNTIFISVQRILYEDVLMDAEKDDITMDSDLYADLSMDELEIELLASYIEDQFDVSVLETEYTKWRTVSDVVYWIEAHI